MSTNTLITDAPFDVHYNESGHILEDIYFPHSHQLVDTPFDVHYSIAQYLPAQSFYSLILSCRSFSFLCHSAAMWSRLFLNILKTELRELKGSPDQRKRVTARRQFLNKLVNKQEHVLKRIVKRSHDDDAVLDGIRSSVLLHVVGKLTSVKNFRLNKLISSKFDISSSQNPRQWYMDKYKGVFETIEDINRFSQRYTGTSRSMNYQQIMDVIVGDLGCILFWKPSDESERLPERDVSIPDDIVDFVLQKIDKLTNEHDCSIHSAFKKAIVTKNRRIIERCLELKEKEIGEVIDYDCDVVRILAGSFVPDLFELVISHFSPENARIHLASSIYNYNEMPFEFIHRILVQYQVPPDTFSDNLTNYIITHTAKENFDTLKDYIERGLTPKMLPLAQDRGFAVMPSSLKVFQYLLDKGADPNESYFSDTLLILMMYSAFGLEHIAMIIKYGADVNRTHHWKRPALLYACQWLIYGNEEDEKDFELIKLLVESGADVNFVADGNINPLRSVYAEDRRSLSQSLRIIHYLQDHGARWTVPDLDDLRVFLTSHDANIYCAERNRAILQALGFTDILKIHNETFVRTVTYQ